MGNKSDIPYVFFGSPDFSVHVLQQLKKAELLPELIVTAPDRERGRGQETKPTAVKAWAQDHDIDVLTPQAVDQAFINDLQERSPEGGWPLFVVVAYGHILPADLIYLPEHNTLNVHPSLLPKQRGAAPIRGTILKEDEAGVTIIELDEKMDHGPIVSQKKLATSRWPPRYDRLKPKLAEAGGQLLAQTIPQWIQGEIKPIPQDHTEATHTGKFDSDDGLINFSDDADTNLRKIRAFTDWPKAHFYTDDGTRVNICEAELSNEDLVIKQVKPAGGSKQPFKEFKDKHNY
jgi:methionyl-tRNA formyltransferase